MSGWASHIEPPKGHPTRRSLHCTPDTSQPVAPGQVSGTRASRIQFLGVTTTSVEPLTNQYHHGSPSGTRKLHDPKIHHECAYSGSHKAHRPRGNSLAKTEPGLLPCREWQACSSQVRDRAGASRRCGHAPKFGPVLRGRGVQRFSWEPGVRRRCVQLRGKR